MTETEQTMYRVSPSRRVHLFSDNETPDCGQTIDGEWSAIREDGHPSPEEVAETYQLPFCSKCFDNSYLMDKIVREADQ